MEGIELICFQIISTVGNARSLYIEAIQAAKAGDFEKAEELIKEGEASFTEGHAAHGKLPFSRKQVEILYSQTCC